MNTSTQQPSTSRVATGREVLRANREFTIFFVTSIISNAGSFMQGIGVPFVLYKLTKSNAWVGASGFASMIPAVLISPVVGPLSDRMDRRKILLWSNMIQAIVALAFLAMSIADALKPWTMLVLLAVSGLASGFQYSTAYAMVAGLVPTEHLTQAVRLNATAFPFARAVGPAIAGLVLKTWGVRPTFALNALSFLFAIGGLLVCRPRAVERQSKVATMAGEFVEGLRYLARVGLRPAIMNSFLVSMLGQAISGLAAGLVAEEYHAGAAGLGWLGAAFGVGAALSSLTVISVGERRRRSQTAMTGVALYGTAVLIAVSTTHFVVGLVGFFVAGFAHVLNGSSVTTSIHAQVSDEYRGRVASINMTAVLLGFPLGSFVGGMLGDRFGLRPVLGTYGGLLLIYVWFVVTRLDGMRLLDRGRA